MGRCMPPVGTTLEQAPQNWRAWMAKAVHFKTKEPLSWGDVISGDYFLYYTMHGQHNTVKKMEEARRSKHGMPFPCDCPKTIGKAPGSKPRQPRTHGSNCIYGTWLRCSEWYEGKQRCQDKTAKYEKPISCFFK